MKTLTNKYVDLRLLNILQFQHLSYLTGISLKNIFNEIEIGNFLISQVSDGKWIFLSEDKSGTEITFREFDSFLVTRILKEASKSPDSIPNNLWSEVDRYKKLNKNKITIKLDPITTKKWNEAFVDLKLKVENLKPVDAPDALMEAIRLHLAQEKQIKEKVQSFVDAIPERKAGFGILLSKSSALSISQKESFAHIQKEIRERMKILNVGFIEALTGLIHERDMVQIRKYNNRIHAMIMERASGKQAKDDGFLKNLKGNGLEPGGYYVDEIQDRKPILENSERIILNAGCQELTPEQLGFIELAGIEGYNAGIAFRDAIQKIAKAYSEMGFRIAEANKEAANSAQSISDLMNIMSKKEKVDRIPGKHLTPKEFGLSLKRNQRRNGSK